MAYIYKITNLLNNKIYVGKTTKTIQSRWKEHIQSSLKEDISNRPLYKAFQKYGIKNFKIEEIEECDLENLSKREIFWIANLNSFKDGYNATLGGEGTVLYDYKLLAKKYLELREVKKVAEFFNCDIETVRKACSECQILITTAQEHNRIKYGKKVDMFSLDNKYLKSFNSLGEAAREMISLKIASGAERGVQVHISQAAHGKRKTAYKHIWKFSQPNIL